MKYTFFLSIFLATTPFVVHAKKTSQPKLTVVFVIDQFAYHYVEKAAPYLKQGLNTLLNKSTLYTNALFPHGMPSTPTGHAALSTGAYGSQHGITSYGRVDETNTFVKATTDSPKHAAVFGINGMHDYGKSPKNIMVDTLSDQFVLSGTPDTPHHAYALSLKNRSAIMMAGHQGKAIWFEKHDGQLTSSKAYYETLPDWLTTFNKQQYIKDGQTFTWKRRYEQNKPYLGNDDNTYESTPLKKSLINNTMTISRNEKNSFDLYKKTPFGHQLLLDASHECIRAHLSKKSPDRMLLWISLSSFDYSGHFFGPDSTEQFDLLYHLDQQIESFMTSLKTIIPEKETLYVLTADHGVMPIPEVMNRKQFNFPERVDATVLIEKMNASVKAKWNITPIVHTFEAPQFYLDKHNLAKLKKEEQEELLQDLKQVVEKYPGIRYCWTNEDLYNNELPCAPYRKLFAQQIYKDRGGQLTCLMQPYQMLSKYPTGTSHTTPYRYDLHVPLAFYQKGRFERQKIHRHVSTLQLAGSLARVIGAMPPSAAVNAPLKEIVALSL